MTAQAVEHLGRTLVLVPHPDDETIGCGGVLALLGRAGVAVQVVLFTEGGAPQRHPRPFPMERLRALRRREMMAALRELGHGPHCVVSLGLPDGGVPARGEPGFDSVVSRLARITRCFRPNTVLMPARDDVDPDRRAACAAGASACLVAAPAARRLEYVVSGGNEARRGAWHVDIAAVIDDKRRALALHRSPHDHAMRDDSRSFSLPAEILARCTLPVETYFHASAGHAEACQ